MSSCKIAIIGAGPAGCTLALLLHRAGIACTIFEGEANANARAQGGTLDLHDNSGLAAIKKAGLTKAFNALARYDGEAMRITNKNLRTFIKMDGAKEASTTGRPEIDRAQLRTLLVESLPQGTIRWNHKLRRFDTSDPSNIILYFDNGAVLSGFDLIVGADGAWSKIRPYLTTLRPSYSGLIMSRLIITDAARRHPEISSLVNRGSLFSFGDGRALTVQQLSEGGDINVGVSFIADEQFLTSDALPANAMTDLEVMKKYLLDEHLAGWAPELRACVEATDTHAPWAAPSYTLPVGTRWRHRAGVTLIGDAAHLMVPWAGEGVNESMLDSLELAEHIITAVRSNNGDKDNGAAQKTESTVDPVRLSKEIKAYEERMFVRSAKTAGVSFEMMSIMFFANDAPDATIDKYIAQAAGNGMPWYVAPLIKWLAMAYFAWFRWRYPGTGRI